MKFGRRAVLSAAAVVASFGLAVLYDRLPDGAPAHGELSPFLVVGVVGLLVFVALPRMLRHAFRIEPSEPAAERQFGRIQPLSAGLVVASFGLAIVVYGRHVDGMPTPWDVIVFPFVVGFVWLSSMAWPRISLLVGGEAAMRTYEGSEIAALGVFLLAGIKGGIVGVIRFQGAATFMLRPLGLARARTVNEF